MIKYNGMFEKDKLHFIQFVNNEGKSVDIQIDHIHVSRFLKYLNKLDKKITLAEPQNDEPAE